MMSFYAMSFEAVMGMPTRRFWFLNSCIPRIMSERELRQIDVLVCTQSSENYAGHRQRLIIEMGTIAISNEADPDAMSTLAALA
jgi:hypothetical protein